MITIIIFSLAFFLLPMWFYRRESFCIPLSLCMLILGYCIGFLLSITICPQSDMSLVYTYKLEPMSTDSSLFAQSGFHKNNHYIVKIDGKLQDITEADIINDYPPRLEVFESDDLSELESYFCICMGVKKYVIHSPEKIIQNEKSTR